MSRIVNEVRIRAKAAPSAARGLAGRLLRSERDGDRIVGVALVQGSLAADNLDDLLGVFATSRSAFEQYQSLYALQGMVKRLDKLQRAKVVDVLTREKADPRGVGVMRDRSIPDWIERVLALAR